MSNEDKAKKAAPKPKKADLEKQVADLQAQVEALTSGDPFIGALERMERLFEAKLDAVLKGQAEAAEEAIEEGVLIRNAKSTPVNLRLKDPEQGRAPFKVNLRQRGHSGDTETIPAHLAQHPDLLSSARVGLIEFITQAESENAERFTGAYQRPARERAVVVSDKTVRRQSIDVKGGRDVKVTATELEPIQQRGVGPEWAAVPGSRDAADPEATKLAESGVMPEIPKKVTRERVSAD